MVNNLSGAPYSSFTPTAPYVTIGDVEAGISFAYQSCVVGDAMIVRIRYADDDELGLAPVPCGKMEVVASPAANPPMLLTVDCQGMPKLATGGVFYWGTNCGGCNEPTPTMSTAWGGIQALYR